MFSPRLLSSLLLIAVWLIGGCSKLPPPPKGGLRVATWNIEWFPGRKPDASTAEASVQMAQARKAVARISPDILLLQEIRDWQAAQELCDAVPGLRVHVASRFDERAQNQVIASKLSADSSWSDHWKAGPITPPRGYSFAALPVADGRFLLCYSLHLKSNRGDFADNVRMRRESARQLFRHVREMLAIYQKRGACAILVGGDLNTSMEDSRFATEPTLRAFQAAGFHWTHQGVPLADRITIPGGGGFPDNCFDHLFTLGLGRPSARALPYPGVSDHYPVVADIDLAGADFQPKIDLAAGEKVLADAPSEAPKTEVLEGAISATSTGTIRAAAGKIATIRGRVGNVGQTASGNIFFINFSGTERGDFVGIVREEHHDAVTSALGGDLRAKLTGRTIELRGEVSLFKGTPEITIKRADQIRFVDR
jgi:endonuclease/exonuclease/phosphatase family metal-dependent hydrolase